MNSSFSDTKLVEVIFKISRFMKGNMSYSSELNSLSLLQIQALSFIKNKQNAQMREIADQFKIEMPTATVLIDKLCKMDLAERQEDKDDRRLVRIVLTKQGLRLLEKALTERTKKIDKIVSYLSEEDKKDLLRILNLLLERIENKK